MDPSERTNQRAHDGPPEETGAGSDDPGAQAAAILADSDERQETRETSEGSVEHRTAEGDR